MALSAHFPREQRLVSERDFEVDLNSA
jgi:hypothetical protein